MHNAAAAAYGLPYAKRVGLRYVNQFDAEHTRLKSFAELKELLRPELSALMATEAWDRPEELISQILLNDDNGRLLLRVVARTTEQQPAILLDLDFFEEGETPLDDLSERCNRYHDVIYRAFRWAIHPDKLETFEPEAKEGRDNDRDR